MKTNQNTKKNVIISLIVVIPLIVALVCGGLLFLPKAQASETYKSSSQASKYNSSADRDHYARCYIYYDNAYVNSVTVPTPTVVRTLDDATDFTISGNFTMGRTGYSWSSSAPTNFDVDLGWVNTSSESAAQDRAYSNAVNTSSAYRADLTFTRNGNNFSLSSGSIPSKMHAFSTTSVYLAIVLKISTSHASSAYFTANKYTLYFDYSGGTGSTSSRQVTYGSTIGSLPTGTRADYKLLGWAWSTGSTSYVSSSTKYSYTSNKTLYAIWQYDGYTLSSSVSGGGGSIVGANTQYSKNSQVTVTAVPNDGYDLDYWNLNGTILTTNPLIFTITQNSTLVAYFKEKPKVTVTFDDDTKATVSKEEVGKDLYVVIDPIDNYYIYSVTIDNVTYGLEYYHANLYGAGQAHLVDYTTRQTNNIVTFRFTYLFGVSTMHVTLVQSEVPSYQNPPSGGATIEGVATLATLGGEARVNGIDISNQNSVVHLSAVAYRGYTFSGWTASNGADLSAYTDSADIPYSIIEGAVVTANFVEKTVSSSTVENTDDGGLSGVL